MTRMTVCWRETVWTTRLVAIAYVAIGCGLTLQPGRFSNTPSYANLIAFVTAPGWGCAYLGVAALLIAWCLARRAHWLGVLAHTAAAILTMWWLAAFVIRYATDSGTTIVNVVSWGVFLSLVYKSSQGIDDYEPA